MDKFKYFKIREFLCPCCEDENMDRETIKLLDEVRELSGIPIRINSGCRCKAYNKYIGGKEKSEHLFNETLKSTGVDISIRNSNERFLVTMALVKVGFNRIGVGKNFIHAGTSKTLPQQVVWVY